MILRILVFGFFICVLDCAAQTSQKKFEHINSEGGLANTTVNYLIQDSKGFIWIATQGGLHQYDGYKFNVYRHDARDSFSISNNNVLSLCESDGLIYAGTRSGLNVLNPSTGKFEHYVDWKNQPGLLKDKSIRSIYASNDGRIWVSVSDLGVLLFDKKLKSFVKLLSHEAGNANTLPGNLVKCITEDPDGGMWFGGDDGLTRYDEAKGKFVYYTAGPGLLVHNYVKALHRDHLGNFWIGTDGGLSYATYKDGQLSNFRNYVKGADKEHNLLSDFVKCIVEDRNNEIWIATDAGLSLLNHAQETFTHYTMDGSDALALQNNWCHALLRDSQNNIWIGTDKGLSKYDDGRFPFGSLLLARGSRRESHFVTALAGDGAGKLWIGTDDGLKIHSFSTGIATDVDVLKSGPLATAITTALAYDNSGHMWIGTSEGLFEYTLTSRKLKHFILDKNNPTNKGVLSLLADGRYVWVGTWDGIFRFDLETDEWGPYLPEILKGRTQAILRDSDDNLWIGLRNKLVCLNMSDGTVRQFVNSSADPFSISYNDINCLYVGKQAGIWIGTNGGGLNFFDKKSERFYRYSWDDGLPSDNILSLVSDKNGALWIGTDNGLSQFDPVAISFTNYDSRDGLQSNAMNRNALYKAEGGEIFVGSVNGVNRFIPEEIPVNPFLTRVLIGDITIYGEGTSPVVINVNEQRDSLTIGPDDKVITFSFVGLNFRNPSKNHYMYMLEGFKDEWIGVSRDQRSVTYTNLAPGAYTFRVKGSNNDGVWNHQEAAVHLVVTPPFYRTTWFRLLLMCVAVVSVYLFVRVRVERLRLRQRRLEAEVTSRTAELIREKIALEDANRRIMDQKDEIEAQKELIDSDRRKLEEAQKLIRSQNEQLYASNQKLEEKVKARTAELNDTVEKMVDASNELDHFVYRAAHDLRGPIARLEGLCYVGQLEQEKERMGEYLHKVEEVSREMNSMLSRLLRTRTINKQDLRIHELRLCELIHSKVNAMRKLEDSEGMRFDIAVPDDLEMSSDKELLEILLGNVIQNAIRFRDRNKKENFISISVEDTINDTIIHIIDNGIGIPADIRQNVFEMFFIGTQHSSGFGLGLYEARIIARKLNGMIYLEENDYSLTHLKIRLPHQLVMSEK